MGTNSELETEPQHHQLPQQERDVDASLAWVSRMVGLTTVITDTIDIIPQTVNNESEETEWPKVTTVTIFDIPRRLDIKLMPR